MRCGANARSVDSGSDCEMEWQCINSFEDSQPPETRKVEKHAESSGIKKKTNNKHHRSEVKAKLRIGSRTERSVVCANLYLQYVYVCIL